MIRFALDKIPLTENGRIAWKKARLQARGQLEGFCDNPGWK